MQTDPINIRSYTPRSGDSHNAHSPPLPDASAPSGVSGRSVALTWFYDFSIAVPHLYVCRELVTRDYLQHTKSRNFIVDINRGDAKGLKNEADRTIRAIRSAGLMNTGRGFAGCRIDALYNTCSVIGCTGFHARRCGALDLRNGTVQALAREVCERLTLQEKMNPKMFYPAWKELSEEPIFESGAPSVPRHPRQNNSRRDAERTKSMIRSSTSWPPFHAKNYSNDAVFHEISRARSNSNTTELEAAEAALLRPHGGDIIVPSSFSLFMVQPDEVVDPMRARSKSDPTSAISAYSLSEMINPNCGSEASRFIDGLMGAGRIFGTSIQSR